MSPQLLLLETQETNSGRPFKSKYAQTGQADYFISVRLRWMFDNCFMFTTNFPPTTVCAVVSRINVQSISAGSHTSSMEILLLYICCEMEKLGVKDFNHCSFNTEFRVERRKEATRSALRKCKPQPGTINYPSFI